MRVVRVVADVDMPEHSVSKAAGTIAYNELAAACALHFAVECRPSISTAWWDVQN